jgi:proline iminopeptidase
MFFILLALLSVSAHADQVNGLYATAYGTPNHPSLVFLHGGPGYNSYTFEYSNAQTLADRGYYVVTFDQRGSGRSEKAPLSEYTYANAVQDVESIVRHYHLHRPIILGHSWGGTLALKYAETFPNSYSAIVLIDAPIDQPGMVKNILDRCEQIYQRRGDSTALGYLSYLREDIFGSGQYKIDVNSGGAVFSHATRCGLYIPHDPLPRRQALWKQINSGPKPQLIADSELAPFQGLIQNEHWMTGNVMPDLVALRANVFGIFGLDDGLFSDDQLVSIQKALPTGHFESVANASHNLFIDQQEVFLKFVDAVAQSKNVNPIMSLDSRRK